MKKKIIQNIDATTLVWLLFAAVLFVVLYNSLNRYFDRDEFEAIHSSWKILQGEKIYVDFFQQHNPFLYYLLTPIIATLGENTSTIIAIRIIVFFMLLLIFIVTYYLPLATFNKETRILSLLLLSTTPIFINSAIEIRPDVPQTLFGLLSLLFLFMYYDNKSLKSLALSSISLAISFLFLQKTIFLIVMIAALLLISVFKKQIYFCHFLIYLLIFSLCISPYFLYLFFSDSLSPYFTLNWILNIKLIKHFLPTRTLIETYTYNTMLWVFYTLGLLFFLKTPKQKRLALLSFGSLISVFFVRVPYPQYFMMSIPMVAIISAHAIHSIFQTNKRKLIAVLFLSILFPSVILLKKALDSTNGEQLKKINYVLSVAAPDDFVYDGENLFNIFRNDIDFFWYYAGSSDGPLATYRLLGEYKYDIYELIEMKKPKIISNYYIDNMADDRISKYYIRSDRYKDIFIRVDSE